MDMDCRFSRAYKCSMAAWLAILRCPVAFAQLPWGHIKRTKKFQETSHEECCNPRPMVRDKEQWYTISLGCFKSPHQFLTTCQVSKGLPRIIFFSTTLPTEN